MNETYTLNCEKCGKPFESEAAFPFSQLCEKCSEVTSTALTTVNPKADLLYVDLGNQAITLSQYAQVRVIKTADDLKAATDDINIIKGLQKQAEDTLKSYIKPFTDYIAEVRAAFKLVLDPLDTALKTNRLKSTLFLQEQERKQREAEELNRQQEELTRRMAAAKNMVATDAGVVDPCTGEVVVPTETMVVPAAIKKVYADTGNMALTDNWQWELVDINQVQREWLVLNNGLITKSVKGGMRSIPGLRIWNKRNVRVTQR